MRGTASGQDLKWKEKEGGEEGEVGRPRAGMRPWYPSKGGNMTGFLFLAMSLCMAFGSMLASERISSHKCSLCVLSSLWIAFGACGAQLSGVGTYRTATAFLVCSFL
ncbi:hypothetical protein TNCT_687831 [Trichonephila clavata]|uniref:Uncharacterized protein n=1 Tax=Trichonephila clavata TaxID=2740835 RepID=A0A8X6I040_TRICU|nr:hypothetical protein TNCT_687831 [Trichonephila clavata]